MWTVLNVSTASIQVNDVPDAQQILPGAAASFAMADFMQSQTLAQNVALGALCVVNYGDFAPIGQFAPVTFPVHPSATETQNGQSAPLTLGPFSVGEMLLNVTALGASGSVAIGFQPFDGATYYPAESVIAAVTAVGPVAPQGFAPYGLAGRFTWTVEVSATFSLIYQVR